MAKTKEKLLKQLEQEQLLPLYTATDLDILPVVEEVLTSNGLNFIEVTYRSDLASAAIKQLSQSGKLIVGAGTVRDLATAKDAIENGATEIDYVLNLTEVKDQKFDYIQDGGRNGNKNN